MKDQQGRGRRLPPFSRHPDAGQVPSLSKAAPNVPCALDPDQPPFPGFRLGLFGGAFNPIHLGHLRAGLEVRESFALDQVLFIPTAIPPHKERKDLVPFAHRLAMVRLATAPCPFFAASEVEGRRRGKSYTIQTLRFFKKALGPKTELFFILGLDALLEIHTWKDYQNLFAFCHFIVMDRPGFPRRRLREYLQAHLTSEIIYHAHEKRFEHPSGHSLYFTPITQMDISSTRIRCLLEKGKPVTYLVPEGVEKYIQENGLYVP